MPTQYQVELIEAADSLSQDSRAYGIHPSTLEMLSSYTVIENILKTGFKIPELSYWDGRTYQCIARCPFEMLHDEYTHPYRLSISQEAFCEIIFEELQKSPYFTMHFGCNFTNVTQNNKGTTVEVFKKCLDSIHADFVCCCDGAHSKARSLLGMPRLISKYTDRFFSFDIENYDAQWILPGFTGCAYIIGGDLHMAAVFKLSIEKSRFVFFFSDTDERTAEGKRQIEETLNKLNEYVPSEYLQKIRITRQACYFVYQSIVDSFNVGRIFLLGDAAHLNSPTGAMGLNTGIQDGYYLAHAIEKFINQNNSNGIQAYSEQRRK